MKLFGPYALEAVRLGQFLMGLLIAYFCGSVSGKLFGTEAKKWTIVIALFSPTLIIMTGEILTETSATLMSAIFLYFLVRFMEKPSWAVLGGLSAIRIAIGNWNSRPQLGLLVVTRFFNS